MPAKKKPSKKKPATKTAKAQAKRKATSLPAGPRADYGQPIDGYIAKQPPQFRAILEALRGLIEDAAPDAQSALKWGAPFFTLNGKMMCAMSAHKAHVNLILVAPPNAFKDPDGLLTGAGQGGRHLKLTSLDDLPRTAVRSWLKTAVAAARQAAR
jgi:hypothetical protein